MPNIATLSTRSPALVRMHQVWLKLIQWFCRRRFLNVIKVFLLFHYNLPLKKGVALDLNKLEFNPRMLCAKFGLPLEKKIF